MLVTLCFESMVFVESYLRDDYKCYACTAKNVSRNDLT